MAPRFAKARGAPRGPSFAWAPASIATRMRKPSLQAIVTALVVGVSAGFVLWQLEPSLLLADTTATGGDTASHVWGPAFLRDSLLADGRITGWAPDWYAGFPAYTFYFPLPGLLIVFLDLFLPYNIAFKLVTVLGAVGLPVAAWAFGRLADLRFPGPAVLAVATLPFLFDSSFTIYGGNLPSTLAGEFSFSISLSLALVFLGVVARGLETGRYRALAAVLLVLTGLSHVIPTMFAVGAAGVLLLLRWDGRRLWYLVTVGAAAAAVVGFWAVPFVVNLPYTNDMGWEKITEYFRTLFPGHMTWVLPLAVAGVIGAVGLRIRTGIALAGMGVLSAVAFVLLPEGRLWNARVLPFWFLCAYLLAGFGFAEVGRAVGGIFTRDPDSASFWPRAATPVVGLLAALFLVGQPLNVLPAFLPVRSGLEASFVPQWAEWNYEGYERKDAYPEYRRLIDTMGDLPCGRAMWEYSRDLNRFGSPMALMLLPYWTDGCIASMEGLFFESTPTVPFHFLNQSELSVAPSRPMRGLPYRETDLDAGVGHLQLMGVRYYLAFSEEILDDARDHPDLDLVATSGPWEIFEVAEAPLVEPLDHEPVVVEGAGEGREAWLDVAIPFYQSGEWEVFPASDGPEGWAQVPSLEGAPAASAEPAEVSDLDVDERRITFEVDRTGSPVLVKTSYFPNWKVDGALGPYRVAPNFMAVVPTNEQVALRYGYTAADVLGWLLTGIGVVALFMMAGRPITYRERLEAAGVPRVAREPAIAGSGVRLLLRRFGMVTLVATGVDVAVLVALRVAIGLPVVVADAIAVSVASLISYMAHRSITFADDPHVRWVRDPATFVWITLLAGLVDIGVLRLAVEVFGSTAVLPVVASKVVALGVAGAVRVVAYRSRLFLEVREEQAHPAERPPAPGTARLSVVLPAYGDAGRISSSIRSVREALAGVEGEIEVIVVDDGSSDGTAEAAREAGAEQVVAFPHNQGKGGAVRAGVLAARGRTIVFTDSDLSYPPEQILRILDEVEDGWDLVVGSRKHIGTRTLVKSGRLRILGGRIYNTLTRAVLLGQYRDTQCGLKGFRSDAAAAIFSKTRLDGFAFDVELFHLAERYRLRLKEVPVELTESPTSTVRYAFDALKMVRDLFRIRYWAGRGLYDPAAVVETEVAEIAEPAEAEPLIDVSSWLERGGVTARILQRFRTGAVERGGTVWATVVGVAIAVGIALWVTRGVWGPLPPAGIDVMGHLVRTEFGIDLLSSGRIDGWFPRFMVGHQTFLFYGPGFTWVVGLIKVLSLGFVSDPTAFKVAVIASYALLPVAFAYAARSFGLDRRSAGLAGILSLTVSVTFGIGIEGLFGTGLIPHQVGAVFFGFTLGAVLRIVDEPTPRRVAIAVAFGALLVLTHLFSVGVLAVMLPFALAVKLAGTDDLWRPIGALVAAGIALVLVVAFWLLPFAAHFNLHGPATGWGPASLEQRLAQILQGSLAFRPGVGWLVLIASAVAFVVGVRGWRPGIAVASLPAFYMLVAHVALAIWPNDFTLPLTTRGLGYAALIATFPLAWLLAAPARWWGPGAFGASVAAAAALVLLPLGGLAEIPRQFPAAVPEMDLAAEELARIVPDGARFAVDRDFPAEIGNTGVVHPETWLTYHSRRSSLNIFNLESSTSLAGFVTEEFGDKPFDESWRAMNRYGASHLVVTSEDMAARVEASPLFEMVWEDAPLAIFSLQPAEGQPPPEALLTSDGELSAEVLEPGPNRMRISFQSVQRQPATVAVGYSPKWIVTIDGRSIDHRRSSDGLVEIDIPAGAHRLDLSFEPDGWDWTGRALTLLALAGGAALLVRRRKSGEGAPVEETAEGPSEEERVP